MATSVAGNTGLTRQVVAPSSIARLRSSSTLHNTTEMPCAALSGRRAASKAQPRPSGIAGSSILGRHPALSADSRFYYQPLGSLNKILVINAATLAVVKQITVGTNPRRVYIQGDTAPHER